MRGEAESGALIAGELVLPHRMPRRCLSVLKHRSTTFAAAVATALLVAEVDRPPAALATMHDLIVASVIVAAIPRAFSQARSARPRTPARSRSQLHMDRGEPPFDVRLIQFSV